MIEKLKKETVEQIEVNTFNNERQKEIREIDRMITPLTGDDFMSNALSVVNAALKKLEHISDVEIAEARQETEALDETIAGELKKNVNVLNAAKDMQSSLVEVDKLELTEKAQEQITELNELHNKLMGEGPEDLTADVDRAIKKVIDSSVRTDHLPSEKRGQWTSGTRGNGKFVLNDNAVIRVGEGKYVTGKSIKEKYGLDGVIYKDNEPDFTPYAISNEIITTVPVDGMPTDRNESYRLAEKYCAEKFGITCEQVREYMEENNLTWHETADRKNIMPIPTEINAAYTHTGGISKQQSFEKLAKAIKDVSNGRPINLCRPAASFKVNAKELSSAIKVMKKRNSSY